MSLLVQQAVGLAEVFEASETGRRHAGARSGVGQRA